MFHRLPVRFLNSPQRAPNILFCGPVRGFPRARPSRAILQALAPFAPANVFRLRRFVAEARFDNRLATMFLLR